MKRLNRDFFSRNPEVVAREVLGKLLVRQKDNKIFVGKIVETEAYLGLGDRASHSYKGMTPRNKIMFGRAGVAYIYFTYGMHWLLNIITEKEDKPSGVLIRAIEPLCGPSLSLEALKLSEARTLGSGPARLTKWMEINGDLKGEDITSSERLFVTDEYEGFVSEKIAETRIISRPRIGIDYAGAQKDLPLRFYIEGNNFVSKY